MKWEVVQVVDLPLKQWNLMADSTLMEANLIQMVKMAELQLTLIIWESEVHMSLGLILV